MNYINGFFSNTDFSWFYYPVIFNLLTFYPTHFWPSQFVPCFYTMPNNDHKIIAKQIVLFYFVIILCFSDLGTQSSLYMPCKIHKYLKNITNTSSVRHWAQRKGPGMYSLSTAASLLCELPLPTLMNLK